MTCITSDGLKPSEKENSENTGQETVETEMKECATIGNEVVNEEAPLLHHSTAVYKIRFLMLFIFSLSMCFNGMLFVSLVPVTDIISKYYKVVSIDVEWLSILFMLCSFMAFPASYCISRWGVRPMVILASFLNVLTVIIQFPSYENNLFPLLLFGQIFSAIAFAIVITSTTKVSSLWFPEHQRTTATGFSFALNSIGMCIGFIQPSAMIEDDVKVAKMLADFHMSRLIVGGVIFLATLFFKERPELPPSLSCERTSVTFRESLSTLMRNKNFHIMVQFASLSYAATISLVILLNTMVKSVPAFHTGFEEWIGWMGFGGMIMGIGGMLAGSRLIDVYHKYKVASLVLNALSFIITLSFVVVLTNTSNFRAVCALYVILGAFNVTFLPIYFEMVGETFYPISEDTCSMIAFVASNMYAFALNLILGNVIIEHGNTALAGYIIASFYGIATLLIAFVKVDMRRSRADSATE